MNKTLCPICSGMHGRKVGSTTIECPVMTDETLEAFKDDYICTNPKSNGGCCGKK